MLRVLCSDKPKSWHVHLPRINEAINTGFNLVLKERPHFLYHGYDPKTKYEVFNDLEKNQDLGERFHIAQYAYDLVEKELSKSYEKRDKVPPGNLKSYTTGDIVYISRHFVSDRARKMRHPFYGPFRVVKVTGNATVLSDLATGKEKRVSQRDMKFFKSQTVNKTDNKNADKVFPEAEGTTIEETNKEASNKTPTGDVTPPEGAKSTNTQQASKTNKKAKPKDKKKDTSKAAEAQATRNDQTSPKGRQGLRPRKEMRYPK